MSKRAGSALGEAWRSDASVAKAPRRRPDQSLETQVTTAVRDNLKPPVWTKWLIDGKLVRGIRSGSRNWMLEFLEAVPKCFLLFFKDVLRKIVLKGCDAIRLGTALSVLIGFPWFTFI